MKVAVVGGGGDGDGDGVSGGDCGGVVCVQVVCE